NNNYYGQSDQPTHPLHVALRFDNFQPLAPEGEKDLQKLEDEVIEAAKTRDLSRLHNAQKEVLLYGQRGVVPTRMQWSDPIAKSRNEEAEDRGAETRRAKRDAVQTIVRKLRTWNQSNKGGVPPYGQLSSTKVRNELQIEWRDFNSNVYDYSSLQLEKPQNENLAKDWVVMKTTAHYKSSRFEDWTFSVQVNFSTGDVVWLAGEPESEEVIRGRAKELRQIAEKMVEAVNKTSAAEFTKKGWIRDQLRLHSQSMRFTSFADYSLLQIVPGVYRLSGEDPNGVYSQRAIIFEDNPEALWETLPFKAPNRDEMTYGRY
ncbi:MAG: hypothetical protein KDB07_06870, partial [Planctomycetes bacterium]|nr:hypothetical protein [Planctomycetota bacterium]